MAEGAAEPKKTLISQSQRQYGEKFQDHLLEQYKLFVASSQHISDRRLTSNNYLLTLNSSLVALYGIALSSLGHHRWNVVIPMTGLLACFLWYSMVRSYKTLNSAKFKVIHELEDHLPAALFRYEWEVTGYKKRNGKYVPVTHLERFLPVLFAIVYALLFLYALFGPAEHQNDSAATFDKFIITEHTSAESNSDRHERFVVRYGNSGSIVTVATRCGFTKYNSGKINDGFCPSERLPAIGTLISKCTSQSQTEPCVLRSASSLVIREGSMRDNDEMDLFVESEKVTK